MLRPIATWLLVLSPLAMMLIFALSAFFCIGPIATLAIAIACIPYLILLAGSIAIRFWTRPFRGPLLFIIPALLLAALHAFTILDHLQTLRAAAARPPGSRPQSVSTEVATAALLAASGVVLVIITGIWTALVLPISAFLASARRRATRFLCVTCSYPRAGLAPNAKCPECGAASSSNLL